MKEMRQIRKLYNEILALRKENIFFNFLFLRKLKKIIKISEISRLLEGEYYNNLYIIGCAARDTLSWYKEAENTKFYIDMISDELFLIETIVKKYLTSYIFYVMY